MKPSIKYSMLAIPLLFTLQHAQAQVIPELTVNMSGPTANLAALVDVKPVALNQGSQITISNVTTNNGTVAVESWDRTSSTLCTVSENNSIDIEILSLSQVLCANSNDSTNTNPDTDGENTNDATCEVVTWDGSGVSYSAGEIVSYEGVNYKLLSDHVSIYNWYPNVAWSVYQPTNESCSEGSAGEGDDTSTSDTTEVVSKLTVNFSDSSAFASALVDEKAVANTDGSPTTISNVTVTSGFVTLEDWQRTTVEQCKVINNAITIDVQSYTNAICVEVEDPDTDGDGILDSIDQCPNTISETEVDSNGCPINDSDGDGVLNSVDLCPNTIYGRIVDDTGCPTTDTGKKVIGYYESWAQWRTNLADGYRSMMVPTDIDPTILTHINFAFLSFGFEIFDFDENGIALRKNPHNTGDYRIKVWEDNDIARIEEMKALKQQNPNLKIIIALGGWNFNLPASDSATSEYIYSDKTNYLFSDMIADVSVAHYQGDEAFTFVSCTGLQVSGSDCVALVDDEGNPTTSRAQFIDSAIKFLREHELDGIDLDWEYPGVLTRGGTCDDLDNFRDFLAAFRTAIELEAVQTGQEPLLLTVATGAAVPSNICADYADEESLFGAYAQLQPYVDWIGMMTYDFYGNWSGVTGPNAPPYAVVNPNTNQEINQGFSVYATVKRYLDAGIDPSKLVLGMATYGRNLSDVVFDGTRTNGGTGSGLSALGSGFPGESTGEYGLSTYFEIQSLINSGYTPVYDTDTLTPYIYQLDNRHWVGYDDEQSLAVKCQMVKEQQLAGGMVWSITNDDHQGTYSEHKFPLLRSVYDCLRGN